MENGKKGLLWTGFSFFPFSFRIISLNNFATMIIRLAYAATLKSLRLT